MSDDESNLSRRGLLFTEIAQIPPRSASFNVEREWGEMKVAKHLIWQLFYDRKKLKVTSSETKYSISPQI